MNKIIFLQLILFFSFSLKGQGVYYDSIFLPPYLKLNGHTLELQTNCYLGSISEIVKGIHTNNIKLKVNIKKKELLLSAKNTYKRPTKMMFTFELDQYKITNPEQFKVYWLDPNGHKTLLTIHSDKSYFPSSIFPFREGDKWFYVDSSLNRLSANFDFVLPFNGNYSIVKVNNKYALINKSLELLTQPVFDTIKLQSNNDIPPVFLAVKNGENLTIDTTGQLSIRPYSLACGFSHGSLFSVRFYEVNGKMGLLNMGHLNSRNNPIDTLTPAIYDAISRVSEDRDYYLLVEIDNKIGVINNKGKEILPIAYDEIRTKQYRNGLQYTENEILACINHQCGFLDRKFHFFTELKYTDAMPFNLGFSLVQTSDGKWGYIDKKGKEYWK